LGAGPSLSGMIEVLSRNLYYPATWWWKREPVPRHLRLLEGSQWEDPEVLQRGQWLGVQRLLGIASEWSLHYRDLLSSLGGPQAVRSWRDFEGLPVLTKETLAGSLDQLRTGSLHGKVQWAKTSGSTGVPVKFCYNLEALATNHASQWRGRRWWGVNIGAPVLTVWGRPLDASTRSRLIALTHMLKNYRRVSVYDLKPESMPRHLELMRRFGPKMIYGYGVAIYRLADYARQQGIDLRVPSLRVIFNTAEMMDAAKKQVAQEVFGAPVAEEYGSSECGAFAMQCPEGGLHLSVENVVVEILQDGKPVPTGEVGEVVVTVLHNTALPFIRYRLGDQARLLPQRCRCGRTLPLMELVGGRVRDNFVTPDGRVLHSALFDYIPIGFVAAGHRGLRHYRLTQKSVDHFVFEMVTSKEFTEAALAFLWRQTEHALGKGVRIDYVRREELPPDPGGKFRCFVSEIPSANAQ